MGSEQSPNTPHTPLSAVELARKLDVSSVELLSQRDHVPHMAHVLGIGASIAALGKDVAFYRRDVQWTNVAPSYDATEINTGFEDNIDFQTYELDELDDIFEEKQFDRIYGYAPDFDNLNNERHKVMVQSLVRLLNDGGSIHIASAKSNFVPNASYREQTRKITYSKPAIIKAQRDERVRLSPEPRINEFVRRTPPGISPLSPDSKRFFETLAVIGGSVAALIGVLAVSKIFGRKN